MENNPDFAKYTSAEDLDKLISLAEAVSHNLHVMDSTASKLRQKSMWGWGIIGIATGMTTAAFATGNFGSLAKIYQIIILGGISVTAITISILLMSIYRSLRRLESDMIVETSVLKELLEIVHELENVSRYRSTIDPVSSVAFRMRIKRLHFAID